MLHPDAIPPKYVDIFPSIRSSADSPAREATSGFTRPIRLQYSMADAVMSAVAMFSLKDPSLLAFEKRRHDETIRNLFRGLNVPSDTQMRTILDSLDPDLLRPMFNDVFGQLQRGKSLEPYVFHEGCYLVSMDARDISRRKDSLQVLPAKKNSKTGEITYHHQMLGAAVVHPDHKQVIPLAPEPIIKQDGDNKNDCERNAGKRLLQKIRNEHPKLKLIVVEDGLASKAPHVLQLKSLDMHFILGAKPDDHEHLFDEVRRAAGRVTTHRWNDNTKKGSSAM